MLGEQFLRFQEQEEQENHTVKTKKKPPPSREVSEQASVDKLKYH